MPRFCTQCGKRLDDNEKFCTKCGAPAPVDMPGTVTLDAAEAAGGVASPASPAEPAADTAKTTVQQPVQPAQQTVAQQPVYQPVGNQSAPTMDPGTTQRWAVAGAQPQPVTPPAPTQQTVTGDAANASKKVNPIIIAVIVIAVAAVIAGVVIFVVKPFDSADDAQGTKIEKVKTDEGSSEEETPVKKDPNTGKKIDDGKKADTEKKSASTAAERDTYNKLDSYYGKLSSYDQSVRDCATTFNQDYIKDSYSIRNSDKTQAENLRDEIESMYDEVNGMTVDTSSKNYNSWKDIITLYDDLFNRIDVICDAWDVSCDYSSPEDHKDEIVAPLARDNISGTNDNKYRVDYEQRYDGAKPVEVE